VTATDEAAFGAIYTRLCVGLIPREEQLPGASVYFEALQDLPFASVRAAAATWMQTPGQKFLPTTGEWYERADDLAFAALEASRQKALPGRLEGDEIERTRVARERFLGELRAKGKTPGMDWGKVADHFAAITRVPEFVAPAFHCLACQDSGWERAKWTDERTRELVEGVRRCSCLLTNPVITARIQKAQRGARARAQSGRRRGAAA
jgi:hypothetical protein|tara:strand:+ start:254 stop:874 length:621 start_codon:yes stop_codon:yes gene_type:complete